MPYYLSFDSLPAAGRRSGLLTSTSKEILATKTQSLKEKMIDVCLFISCIYNVKALNYIMILSFGDKATEDVFNGVNSKAARSIPVTIWKTAGRKLDMLNAARELIDLKSPPSNKLEKLKGKLSDFYSIRINDQYRIIFVWNNQNAENVIITDYH